MRHVQREIDHTVAWIAQLDQHIRNQEIEVASLQKQLNVKNTQSSTQQFP